MPEPGRQNARRTFTPAFPRRVVPLKSGEAILENPAHRLLFTTLSGFLEEAQVDQLTSAFDGVFENQGGPVEVFHDWFQVKGYTPQARVKYVAWARPRAEQAGTVHILFGSRLVAMGVSVASLVLPFLRSYGDRRDFEARRAAALGSRSPV